ncbi:prepilin-type N-terminal cleavage/methylation domain-containing protein, partial [Candidatus Aerophobetes bacterium]
MKIFSKGNKKRAGFTLIELMIVVIVVGILA